MSRFLPGIFKPVGRFLFGTPEKRENVSTLRPEQEQLYNQLQQANLQPGAGGSFGTAADYYRDLLSNNNADMGAFSAPELRRYNEDIVPGLSEQFAGMGAGGLSSSGFRNAQTQGAVDLSERLAQIRANLRQSAAQGLTNIGQMGLNPYSQNMVTEQGSQGFLSAVAPAFGQAAAGYAFGPSASGSGNRVGANTGPYQGGYTSPQVKASPSWSYNAR